MGSGYKKKPDETRGKNIHHISFVSLMFIADNSYLLFSSMGAGQARWGLIPLAAGFYLIDEF